MRRSLYLNNVICLHVQTVDYDSSSYRERPDVVTTQELIDEITRSPTPDSAGTCRLEEIKYGGEDESALLSQLTEACQLSAVLHRGLDVCDDIHREDEQQLRCRTELRRPCDGHSVARQLHRLRHLYQQVFIRFYILEENTCTVFQILQHKSRTVRSKRH